jgi:organic radical activating enzyme
MEVAKFPINEILVNVEGEGPKTGEVLTLVRFGHLPEFKYLHCVPRLCDIKLMTALEIAEACSQAGRDTVHIMGSDPSFCMIDELLETLDAIGYRIYLDVTGFHPFERLDLVSFLSVGPYPRLPVCKEVIRAAHELRLFWSINDTDMWEANIERILAMIPRHQTTRPIVSILPREANQEEITGLLEYCRKTGFNASIPLYKVFHTIDHGVARQAAAATAFQEK